MIKVRPVRAGDQADAFRIWKDGICGKIPVQPMTNILAMGDNLSLINLNFIKFKPNI